MSLFPLSVVDDVVQRGCPSSKTTIDSPAPVIMWLIAITVFVFVFLLCLYSNLYLYLYLHHQFKMILYIDAAKQQNNHWRRCYTVCVCQVPVWLITLTVFVFLYVFVFIFLFVDIFVSLHSAALLNLLAKFVCGWLLELFLYFHICICIIIGICICTRIVLVLTSACIPQFFVDNNPYRSCQVSVMDWLVDGKPSYSYIDWLKCIFILSFYCCIYIIVYCIIIHYSVSVGLLRWWENWYS